MYLYGVRNSRHHPKDQDMTSQNPVDEIPRFKHWTLQKQDNISSPLNCSAVTKGNLLTFYRR